MIIRAEIDPTEQTSDSEAAEPWLAALQKAAGHATAMGEAFEVLRLQFEMASERAERMATPAASEIPGLDSAAAPQPVGAPEVSPTGPAAEVSPELPPSDSHPALGAPSSAGPISENSTGLPVSTSTNSPATDQAIPAETVQLAAQLAEVSQRFLRDQTSADAIHESLAAAVDFMTQAAGSAASAAEVQQLAAQVESLRGAVHNLQSRASISRAN